MIKNLLHHIPPELKPYVRSVSSYQSYVPDHYPHRISIFANGFPGIFFIESDRPVILDGDTELSKLFVYGQTVKPIEIAFTGSYKAIIFSLIPQSLRALFRIKAKELTDECTEVALLPFKGAKELQHQLYEEEHLDEQVKQISSFLCSLLPDGNLIIDKALLCATATMEQTKGDVSLKRLQENLNITERTFERKFQEYVGVSPKLYARICRFSSMVQHLEYAEYSKLSDIAYEYGFSDQSHFNKTFKEFAGLTPSEYLKNAAKIKL